MSGLVLTLCSGVILPDELDALQPLAMAGVGAAQAARMPVSARAESPVIGELFDVTVDDGAEIDQLTLRCGSQRLNALGRGMAGGSLRIEGDAGAGLGRGMTGGSIVVEGDCGDFAASGMRAGFIRVEGRAGHFLGGAMHGDLHGMAGGVVAVRRGAGDRAGHRMRRGLLLVGGDCGEACGAGMLAGTIAAARCAGMPGLGLRRGSLLLQQEPAAWPVTFNDSGLVDLAWLGLLAAASQAWLPGFLPANSQARRHCGDLACGGKGEILIWQA